jgi:hypothetical protein
MDNQRFVDAALMRLRSEIMEHKAIVDLFFENPIESLNSNTYLTTVIEHMKAIVVCENAYRLIHQSYKAAPPPAVPAPPDGPPKKLDPEQSPTLRRALEQEEKKAARKSRSTRKKKDNDNA